MATCDVRVERIETADGSWTLRDVDRDLTFRSVHGAATESDHVFVRPSGILDASTGRPWRVLELGFGAGLNFHRTRLVAAERGLSLEYVALERAPVPASAIVHGPITDSIVGDAMRSGTAVEENVKLQVVAADWAAQAEVGSDFDAVYHDPFGPRDNPEAWTEDCFGWSRALVRADGRLLTYAVAGHVRRAMAAAGWLVEKRPGPPGKREVLVASPALSDARE